MGVIIQTVLSNCSTTLKSNQIVFIPFLPIISCCALCNVKLTSNPPSMTSSVTRAHWGSCQWTATPPEVFRGSYCAHRFHRKRRSSHTPVQHQLGSQKRWDKAVWVLGQKSVVPFLLPFARGIASCHTWFTWCSTLGSVDILNLLVGILILLVERLTRLNCGFSAASYHCLPLSIHIWKPSPTHILSWCGVPVSWCVVISESLPLRISCHGVGFLCHDVWWKRPWSHLRQETLHASWPRRCYSEIWLERLSAWCSWVSAEYVSAD